MILIDPALACLAGEAGLPVYPVTRMAGGGTEFVDGIYIVSYEGDPGGYRLEDVLVHLMSKVAG